MTTIEEYYPQPCPFCKIAEAYPPPAAPSSEACVPTDEEADPTKVDPECFLVLNSTNALAFLDIMPMTRGHLLVATRAHREKIEHVEPDESRDIGFYLPLLARALTKTLGVSDYNVVQNNGPRAAQVVPHVHFHLIPRPPPPGTDVSEVRAGSWTMFGRGLRSDLDEADGAELAAVLRRAVAVEVEGLLGRGKL